MVEMGQLEAFEQTRPFQIDLCDQLLLSLVEVRAIKRPVGQPSPICGPIQRRGIQLGGNASNVCEKRTQMLSTEPNVRGRPARLGRPSVSIHLPTEYLLKRDFAVPGPDAGMVCVRLVQKPAN